MIKVNTKKLNAALAIASRCCHTGAIPVLTTVLIEAKGDGRLYLSSSNLDMAITTSVEAHVEESMAICIHGRHISRIISNLDPVSAETTLSLSSLALHVRSGPSKFKLPGMPAAEFPKLPDVPESKIVLKQSELRGLLHAVANAQSDDASRHILNGSYIKKMPGGLHAVATDGRRLHMSVAPNADGLGDSGIIMPAKCVAHLLSLLGDEGNVTIAIEDTRRMFAVIETPEGFVTFVSKLVEGNYPNWQQVLPKNHTTEVTLNREEFHEREARIKAAPVEVQSPLFV